MSDLESGELAAHEPAAEEDTQAWIVRALGWLLRLALVLLFGMALGVAVYLGGPALFRAATEPVAENRADIERLQAEMQAMELEDERQVERLRQQVNQLGAELSEVEVAQASQAAALEDLSQQLDSQRIRAEDFEEFSRRLAAMEMELANLQGGLEAISESDPALVDAIVLLREQVVLVRTMELISRARSELLRENLGLAQENLEAAAGELAGLESTLDENETTALQSVEDRLRLAQEALPADSAVAAEDLEAAWRLLLEISKPVETTP